MTTTKRHRRPRGQHFREQELRSRRNALRRAAMDRDRAKETANRVIGDRRKAVARALGISYSRLSHRLTDEKCPVERLDEFVYALAAAGVEKSSAMLLEMHLQKTLARAYGELPEPCLVRSIEATLEPDAAEDVAKSRVLLSAYRNGSVEQVPTEKLRDLKAVSADVYGTVRALYIRVTHELSRRAA